MLEKMSEFFENRLDGYDEHMLTNIAFAEVFYPFTADCLPKNPNLDPKEPVLRYLSKQSERYLP